MFMYTLKRYIYAHITEENVAVVLSSRLSKAKGPDGTSLEEMKKVPLVGTTLLYKMMLYTGCIPTSLQQCRTTLIPKTGADLKDMGGWRSVTIFSLIYRIFAKILAG